MQNYSLHAILIQFKKHLNFFSLYLEKLGVIRKSKVDTAHYSFYKWKDKTTHELANSFKGIGKRLEELEKEYCVDVNHLPFCTNLDVKKYSEIKSGRLLLSDDEIDSLERFFGKRIITRWKFSPFEKLLYSTCERICEGWKENERIKQLMKERDIKIPERFKAKIIPPKNLLENSLLTCDQVIVSLIEPLSSNEIRAKLGYRSYVTYKIMHILNAYGIIEKGKGKYVLSSFHPFEIAFSKLSKRIEKYRAYVEALTLHNEAFSLSDISQKVNISLHTLQGWIYEGKKPKTISNYTANLLMKRGIIAPDEIELFRHYRLIAASEF
jgi:hypothetical protein